MGNQTGTTKHQVRHINAIECDGCGKIATPEYHKYLSLRQTAAQDLGWRYDRVKDKDFCKECSK